MAITFTKNPSNVLNPIFNNNTVIFSSSLIGTLTANINISFNGEEIGDFRISPDPDGNFEFNFFEIIKASYLNSKDNFQDNIELSNVDDFDIETSSYNATVIFTVSNTSGGNQSITQSYKFYPSVHNFESEEVFLNTPTLLLPNQGINKAQYNLTRFLGYPFDFSYFTSTNLQLTFRTNNYTNTNNTISRFFLCDGVENLVGVDNFETLETNSTITNYEDSDIIIKNKNRSCGSYLKWFNKSGGWSYWLFEPIEIDELNTGNIGEIQKGFEDWRESIGTSFSTGKTANIRRSISAEGLEPYEFDYVKEIADSPIIYFYHGSQNTIPTKPWEVVRLRQGTFRVKDKYNKFRSINFDIIFERNTQTF